MHRYFLGLGFATLIACGSSSPSGSAGSGGSGGSSPSGGGAGNSKACVAGQQVACACADGTQGAQACKSDGSAYLACACAAGGANAGGDAGGNDVADGGMGAESGAADAGAAGAGGSSGAGDGTAVATLNQPCSGEGSPACQGHAGKQQLICSLGKWTSNGTCAGSNNCDTALGANAGSCQPIAPECAGLQPGDTYCSKDSVEQCGPDSVTIVLAKTCTGTKPACLGGICVECAPTTTGCADALHLETCSSAGVWGPATSCGGGPCELCNGSDSSCNGALGTYGCGF